MELVSELATQITEMNYGAETYGQSMMFQEEAQDYFNEMYDEYEMMFNNIANIYSDNKKGINSPNSITKSETTNEIKNI